jgi:hypothetical protein
MTNTTTAADEAYIMSYEQNGVSNRAVVVAGNPLKARNKLEEFIIEHETNEFNLNSIAIRGVMRKFVHEAQERGVAEL